MKRHSPPVGQPSHGLRNFPRVRCYRCQQLGHIARNCPGPHNSQRLHPGHVTGSRQNKRQGVCHSQRHNSTQTMQDVGTCQQYTQTPHCQGSAQTREGTGQPKTSVDVTENFWLQSVLDWFPYLHNQTYFLPPLHFNRVSYNIQTVSGLPVLVPQVASDQAGQVPVDVPSGPSPLPNPPPLASQLYQPVPSGDPLAPVYDCDVRDDRALQQVLQRLQQVAERRQEVMMVLSQLQFRKYLDNQVDPITTAATHQKLLPTPATLGNPKGDFDVLIISRQNGLIVGEVKSVGAKPDHTTDQAVVAKVKRAVKQLNTAHNLLGRLVSDLGPISITKILMLPNVTTAQLVQAIDTNPQIQQDLCQCVGATDTAAAVACCLCADSCDEWWERSVSDHGQDRNMTNDTYERLVARFCGPATSIEVPTVTTPRHSVEMKALSEAIAHTGLRMATLALYPEQVDLLNSAGLHQVLLWGPPGTGKTIVLYLKALQWKHWGKEVHLLSSHRKSRAATLLIQHQLQHAPRDGPAAAPAATPHVHCHMYDFENIEEDVETAVNKLAAAAYDGELFLIIDEAFRGDDFNNTSGRFSEFVTHLSNRVPSLHLWAAAVVRVQVPPCFSVETLTRPLRCPPAVLREVDDAWEVDDNNILSYSINAIPAPTDGPTMKMLQHGIYTRKSGITPLPDHTGIWPENCERCGDNVAQLLMELRVGQPGQDLQYRDTIILCDNPRVNMAVATRFEARNLPVQVVTADDDEPAVRDVALGLRDAVTVTDWSVVTGLERRIVVLMGIGFNDVGGDRLREMSRCTSLLVYVSNPLRPSH